MDNWNKSEEKSVPKIESFFSKLNKNIERKYGVSTNIRLLVITTTFI